MDNKLDQALAKLNDALNNLEKKVDDLNTSFAITNAMLKEVKLNLESYKLAKECKKTRTPMFKRLFKKQGVDKR